MMNTSKLNSSMFAALLVGVVSLAACGDDTAADGEGGSDGTGGATTSVTTTTTGGPASTSGGGGEGPGTGGAGGEGPDLFVFATDDYDAYEQIDRHAAPEAGTAGIAGEQGLGLGAGANIDIRDDYNASNPVRDAAGDWIAEISENVTIFHSVLDDDITAFGLTPATVSKSLAQAGPVIVPDTIKYDPAQPTAYPNGRTLEDQVVDITLAAVLLDLDVHPLTILADLPLNPPENDVPFEAEFPFLAPPH